MMTILALQSICVNMRSVSTTFVIVLSRISLKSGQSPELAEVAIVTLQGVATRLGFKSLAQLYLY
jgi:hypothetical protein